MLLLEIGLLAIAMLYDGFISNLYLKLVYMLYLSINSTSIIFGVAEGNHLKLCVVTTSLGTKLRDMVG